MSHNKITFRVLYPDYEEFKTRIIDVIQKDFPLADWCSYDKMLVPWETIFNFMDRVFNFRQIRQSSAQTHNLIINEFIDRLPGFHLKQSIYLKDNFSKLFDVNNLGEMQTINNLVNTTQNQKQLLNSLSASTISPHAFTDALIDMSISDITKNEVESQTGSDLTSKNDSQSNTKRVQTLDKLIQLADTNFRIYLKDLMGNFENYFVRFITPSTGDQDIFIKLLDILKNSQNITLNVDKKNFNISFDISNIQGPLSDILNNKVDLTRLETVISTDKDNVLVEGKDKKLFVQQGQGITYKADEVTMHLDDASHTFNVWGLRYSPKKKGDPPVLSGSAIKMAIDQVSINKKDCLVLYGKTNQNAVDIINNGTSISTNKYAIDRNSTAITNINTTINTECVKNNELNKIVVDKKVKPDNILQVVNNSLYVPSSEVTNNFKIMLTEKDFTFKIDNVWQEVFLSNKDSNFKQSSLYYIIYNCSNPPSGYNKYKSLFSLSGTTNYSYAFSFSMYIPNLNRTTTKEFTIGGVIINGGNADDKGTAMLRINSYYKGYNITRVKDTFQIYELANYFPIPPTPPVPPKPILTRDNVYESNKTIFEGECEKGHGHEHS